MTRSKEIAIRIAAHNLSSSLPDWYGRPEFQITEFQLKLMTLCLTDLPTEDIDDLKICNQKKDHKDDRWRRKLSPRHTGYTSQFNENFNTEAVSAHVNSFNDFIDSLNTTIIKHAPAIVINLSTSKAIKVEIVNLTIKPPSFTPAFARETRANYCGPLHVTLKVSDGPMSKTVVINAGDVPVMVGSKLCLLHGKTREERIRLREDERDAGGYFISNGQDKVVRLYLDCLSNTPLAFTKYRSLSTISEFAPAGVHYKGVREDGHVYSTVIQARKDNFLSVKFTIDGRYIYVPLILVLRALVSTTDKEIYSTICTICASAHPKEDGYVSLRVEAMLRDFHKYRIFSHKACKQLLGGKFRMILSLLDRYDLTDVDCCDLLFEQYLLINIPKEDTRAKFNMMCLMARKCLLLFGSFIKPDSPDLLSSQEALTPGAFFKAEVTSTLIKIMRLVSRNATSTGAIGSYELSNSWISHYIASPKLWRPLSSGLRSLAGPGVMRAYKGHDYSNMSGLSVLADRINYVRFLAHFRCINRGNAFATHKITSIRKLYPESYGFQCAVHTPDGAPCGILTHLCYKATVLSSTPTTDQIANLFILLAQFGLSPSLSDIYSLCVVLNGTILGYLDTNERAIQLVACIRAAKVKSIIFPYTEVVFIEKGNKDHLFPGIYMNTSMGRFYRPVHSLTNNSPEYITPLEQIFLQIAIYGDDVRLGVTTHQEITPTSLLSILGLLVPFSDHNQSPRNMYECQMLKQTMGIPCRNLAYKYDTKSYLLTTPQKPLVRNAIIHDIGGFDTHPTGTNLVVAVSAYTSYDMEDAALINKASLERGLFHGTVYSVHDIDCYDDKLMRYMRTVATAVPYLKRSPDYIVTHMDENYDTELDEDGLPPVGAYLSHGSVFYQTYDPTKQCYSTKLYHHEPGFVEKVIVIHKSAAKGEYWTDNDIATKKKRDSSFPAGDSNSSNLDNDASDDEISNQPGSGSESNEDNQTATPRSHASKAERKSSRQLQTRARTESSSLHFIQRVRIVIRHDRTPVVGDKVASRHGQKGIMGIRWRQTDMPFTSSGIVPDLIINPHAFPSRMTVGMLIESLASKIGVHYADFVDSSPFQWSDERRAIDVFGEQLLKTGQFNRYGSEVMYSAITGDPMPADIFIGVVYYQRLRHMVSDKYQVRAEGPSDKITKQPIKGRKRGGGLRFGEMERDALLAHGAMASLRGRLCTESDATEHVVCAACGSLLGMQLGGSVCRECKATGHGRLIQIPMVLLVLANDLAAMGVRMRFNVSLVE